MKQNSPYKIGTRGSLLALTQCNLIKEEIEKKTKESFVLKTIKTQGDLIQDKPLWQLDGKDFFTKELDHALLTNDVDLVVHSYKDLGSERPAGIKLQTITKRSFAHDILLIKKTTIKDLKNKKKIIVGTSSPRRTINLTQGLSEFLPYGENLEVECRSVRGNVNTRIEKLLSGEYDAIVLALAGIERLAHQDDSKKILAGLLKDLNFMVLPQTYFPSAASQGALAIECLESASPDLQKTLSSVHDDLTAIEMERERKAFKSYGGGCHLAVGIYVKKIHDFFIHIHRGTVDDRAISKLELEGVEYKSLKDRKTYEVFGEKDFLITKEKLKINEQDDNLFVTSSHCFHAINKNNSSLWAAGNRTMKKLASLGHWVCGSSEGLGHEIIEEFKNSKAIELMLSSEKWKVLSHENAESFVGDIISCYDHSINTKVDDKLETKMLNSEVIYWSSIIQYKAYLEKYPSLASKIHCCGLGKTYLKIKEMNPEVIPCIGMKHFKTLTT